MSFITQYWRQIRADKSFSVISLLGLTVATTCSLIIFIYVSYHSSFANFHKDSDRIYRLLTIDTSQVDSNPAGMVTNALIPAIRSEIPEVELATRFQFSLSVAVRVNNTLRYLDEALIADPEFFSMFNFPLVAGVSGEALSEPNTAVISQSFANQLFGEQDPIGKVINLFNTRDMRVVGVIADMPENSHIQSKLIFSLQPDPSWSVAFAERNESWRSISMQSYIKLYPGSNPELVEQKLKRLMEEREGSGYISVRMQPLEDIHLHSQEVQAEVNANKMDYRKMLVLSGVAGLLIVIAVCNFVNLSTAKAVTRSKEIGIRKTVGASRVQLIRQFLIESFIMLSSAAILGLILIELISPWTALPAIENQLAYLFANATRVFVFLAALVSVALIAGIYPALVLSSQKSIGGLKGSFAKSKKGIVVRRALVTVQIAISTMVIIALLVINAQIGFLQNRSLGFDANDLLYVDFPEQSMLSSYETLANELESIPEFSSFTNSDLLPGGLWGKSGYTPQQGGQSGVEVLIDSVGIDEKYIQTLKLDLIEGQSFNVTMSNSALKPIILNQAAVRSFGWADSPIGKILRHGNGEDYRVVGVVADALFRGPQYAVQPLAFHYNTQPAWGLIVSVAPQSMSSGLVKLRDAWERIYPDNVFEYTMLSDRVEGLIDDEVEFASQLFDFTFISMLIACLGLYGHATFSANQNAREMGIRRVFGASSGDIFNLLLREYGALVLIANLIAWPVGFILVNLWLADFAEPIDAQLSYFVQGALLVLCLGGLTISAKMWGIIRRNPATTLRYE